MISWGMRKTTLLLGFGHNASTQMLLPAAIIAVLLGLAVQNYNVPLVKAKLAEAFMFSSVLKQEIVLFHAETGKWPTKKDISYLLSDYNDRTLDFDIRNGAFVISIDTNDKRIGVQSVAFNRVGFSSPNMATILWDCGQYSFSQDVDYYREFPGNSYQQVIPSICRAK